MAKRRKDGHDAMAPLENRDVTRSCRLTASEADALQRAAQIDRMRPTAFMREAIMAKVRRVLKRAGTME